MEVRCPNPVCGRTSTLGNDLLGRVFRCTRCRTKLPPRSPARSSRGRACLGGKVTYASHVTMHAGVSADALSGVSSPPSAARAPIAVVPTRLGRFQILEVLGSGTFATVYRAFDPDLERDVALKVPHEAHLRERRVLDRFLGEARALARLRHPQIVPIYEVGCDGVYFYFVMALIEGRSLDAVIKPGPLAYRRTARIVCDLADALAYAHDLGIVHRDVKPANILLDPRDRAYLTDFGLAHRRGLPGLASPARSGAIIGTPAYLAPEQTRTGAGASCRPPINTAWASSCTNSSAAAPLQRPAAARALPRDPLRAAPPAVPGPGGSKLSRSALPEGAGQAPRGTLRVLSGAGRRVAALAERQASAPSAKAEQRGPRLRWSSRDPHALDLQTNIPDNFK